MRAPTRGGSGPCVVSLSAGFHRIAIQATPPKAAEIAARCHLFMDVGRAWPGMDLTGGRRIGRCLASISERKNPAWADNELTAAIPSPVLRFRASQGRRR